MSKRFWLLFLDILIAIATLCLPLDAQQVTLTGVLQASNGLPASNFTLAFTPTQWFYVAGTGVVINTTTYCGTSVDGSTVGIANPLQQLNPTPAYSGGTLPAGNYYVQYAWTDASSNTTLVSPEQVTQLTGTGQLNVPSPTSGFAPNAATMAVYIGATSGGETLQGAISAPGVYVQSTPLAAGASPPAGNTTICKQTANDAGWPTGTGYTVALVDPSGNTYPGYPMTWQLLGPNTTINLANGLPYYHGVVTYPVPILAQPLNHAPQSISGPLSMTGYNVVNVGALGVGTGLPAWGVDVEGAGTLGLINALGGYLYNGAAPLNHVLLGNGTAYIDSATIPGSIVTGLPSSFYYQTVLNGGSLGSAVAQRGYLAVGTGTGLVANDVLGPPARTVIDVNTITTNALNTDPAVVPTNVAGTAGNCMQWDSVGGAADSGTTCAMQMKVITTGICTTGNAAFNLCGTPMTETWATPFADTNYGIVCQAFTPTSGGSTSTLTIQLVSKSTTGFVLQLQNGDTTSADATTTSEIDCLGKHI